MFISGPRGVFRTGQFSPLGARPATTGRSLVLLRHGTDAVQAGIKVLESVASLSTVRSSDIKDTKSFEIPTSTALVLESIGVAIVNGDPGQIGRMSVQATRSDSILAVEPERVVYAASIGSATSRTTVRPASGPTMSLDYGRGYRDGFNHAAGLWLEGLDAAPAPVSLAEAAAFDESRATWGLHATGVVNSPWTGAGIKIAVLDTGFDAGHPDFDGRPITAQSFIDNEEPQDILGHGTHCIGTAAGPRQPGSLPRYGIAWESAIYVGKVLNNQGSGGDGDILAGIDWAVKQGCRVVSMSLGAPVQPGQKPSTVFENMARRALAAGTLIVAAAGNESDRPSIIRPVSHPANCPSIMAVAAVDASFKVAFFSDGGTEPNGGQVDIAGPGVDVRSSWPRPQLYNTISGTSMATPHVAGIAALHAQANAGISAVDLWTRLVKTASQLPLPSADVGSGLVQAPE